MRILAVITFSPWEWYPLGNDEKQNYLFIDNIEIWIL